jgi:DNA-binding response OmpR family regulator
MSDVLIVEDDILIADMLQTVLEAEGYFVTDIARTVEEATLSVGRHQPDFAVIDVRLANGDLGTDIRACLSKDTRVPILFSTGSGSGDPVLTTAEGDAVLTKPYRLEEVGRGLEILAQLAASGKTSLAFPRNFRLLEPA